VTATDLEVGARVAVPPDRRQGRHHGVGAQAAEIVKELPADLLLRVQDNASVSLKCAPLLQARRHGAGRLSARVPAAQPPDQARGKDAARDARATSFAISHDETRYP